MTNVYRGCFAVVSLGGTLLLSAGCERSKPAQLQSVKIQSAFDSPALVIRRVGDISSAEFITLKDANRICNMDLDLGPDFDPIRDKAKWDVAGADASCARYGTYQEYPWMKAIYSPNVANKAFYLDTDVRKNYPLGRTFTVNPNVNLDVTACYLSRNATDTVSTSSCVDEGHNYFAKETQGLSKSEAAQKVGQAIGEALSLLTYSDQGLSACYEEALAETEQAEHAVLEPELRKESLFRFVRRTGGVPSDINYLRTQINNFSAAGRAAYANRLLLAARLGYVPDEATAPNIAFEPFGRQTLDEYENQVKTNLQSKYSKSAAQLATAANPSVTLKSALVFLQDMAGEYFVQAAGSTNRLDSLPSSSYSTQNGTINPELIPLYSDLVYRAVMLAKASHLKPLAYFAEFKKSSGFQESCDDYARYRPGVPAKRDALLAPQLLTGPESNSSPKLLQGEWFGGFTDANRKPYSPSQPFVVNVRNETDEYACRATADNPLSYCALHVWFQGGKSSNRYESYAVTVRNMYNISSPVFTRTFSYGPYLLGEDVHKLITAGFFTNISPSLSIEGIKGEARELLFTARLSLQEPACGTYALGDTALKATNDKLGTYTQRCEKDQAGVARMSFQSGTCSNEDQKFDAATLSCISPCLNKKPWPVASPKTQEEYMKKYIYNDIDCSTRLYIDLRKPDLIGINGQILHYNSPVKWSPAESEALQSGTTHLHFVDCSEDEPFDPFSDGGIMDEAILKNFCSSLAEIQP